MKQNKRKYEDGFNQGYNLKKLHPDLFDRLVGAMKEESSYKQSLTDGAKQFEKEHIQQQIQTRSQNKNNKRNL